MPDFIHVASSTDSQQAIEEAAAFGGGEVVPEEPSTPGQPGERPAAVLHGPRVESTTDSAEQVAEVQKDLDEEREIRKEEYLDPSRKRLVRRISRLTSRFHRTEDENKELRQRLEQYEPREQPGREQPQQQPQPSNGHEPQPESNYELVKARPPQAPAANNVVQMEELMAAHKRGVEEWPQKAKAVADEHPDYLESVGRLDKEFPTSVTVQLHLVTNVENGPRVAYFLSKHPEVVSRLWQLEAGGKGPEVIGELNAISASLKYREKAPPERRRSNSTAPRPMPYAGGVRGRDTSKSPDEMTMTEYKAWRNSGGGR